MKVCLGCGAGREDNLDSFSCPSCHIDMGLPAGWDEIVYWMIHLDDGGAFRVREFVQTPGGGIEPSNEYVTDSLGDARARMPLNTHRTHAETTQAMVPGTLVEIWRPDVLMSGRQRLPDHPGPHADGHDVGSVVGFEPPADPGQV